MPDARRFATDRLRMGCRNRALRTLGAALLAAILGLSACSGPKREGPQIPKVPEGFLWDANARKARNIFPDDRKLRQGAWATFAIGEDDHSSIYITTYRGPCTPNDVADARQDHVRKYGGHVEYGPIEDLTIDRRDAWGWLETQRYKDRISSYQYTAVIPYDTLTYTVEFHSSQERFMDPAFMRDLVGTFIVR